MNSLAIDMQVMPELLQYAFMRHAFMAGTLAAILAGSIGYFVALRNLAFAGHALTHIGFAGAAAAGLLGLTPLGGQLIVTIAGALGMSVFGERLSKSDLIVGIILAFALGLGSLFLHFYNNYAGQASAILFGDLLGVSLTALRVMMVLTGVTLLVLAVIARPLLFSSLEPELAQAKGVRLTGLAALFLVLVAITVTLASQVVGVLLVFTLLIGPAAIALRWTRTFGAGLLLSVILAVGIVWAGISLAYFSDWPISFWISSLVFCLYLFGKLRRC